MVRSLPIRRRSGTSLTTRVSVLLALTAIIPLLIVFTSSQWLSRPQLIAQASRAMQTNAQARVQLIDAYLTERLHDVQTISRLPFLHQFLAGNQDVRQQAFDELSSGDQRDANYDSWSLLDPNGSLLLWYPTSPKVHGKYLVLPDDLTQLHSVSHSIISDIFYNPSVSTASLDIYMPVLSTKAEFVGVIRATLSLTAIADIINSQADGTGSYAQIIDRNGIRIGYTNSDISTITQPAQLFKAVHPLSTQLKQLIAQEDLYGNSVTPVSGLNDPILDAAISNPQSSGTFEGVPSEQHETFEAAMQRSSVAPWTYVVFSPLSTITTIADQQLLTISIISAFLLLLAILVGLGVGRRITLPILSSVKSLLNNSQDLKKLANTQQATASEQKWIIESSRVGMQSVQYYTDATITATNQLSAICTEIVERWRQREYANFVEMRLQQMMEISKYIQRAAEYQDKSNKNLATAIRVTTQVTDQLATSAESTNRTADQMEQVVAQLRQIVGK